MNNINATSYSYGFKKLEGHYEPGYIYGTAKIHKNASDPSLRPIITQITSPTYEVAKKLNSVMVKYIPSNYMLNSTDAFINLLNNSKSKGIIASLDVK